MVMQKRPAGFIAKASSLKIQRALIKHVYDQGFLGLFSSLFCASIIFISQFDSAKINHNLFIWATFFITVTVIRVALLIFKKLSTNENPFFWRILYTIGSFLGGASWGVAGILLLPISSSLQQMILILMLAGVTAGAVPLSAGILEAAIFFLLASILPFIINIAMLQERILLLFNITLSIYLIYTIILTVKSHSLLKNSIVLQFENDSLLLNLEIANAQLHKSSTHDVMTKMPNRRFFEENIKAKLDKAKINKNFLAILYMDLDHFKEANDKFGHNAGDAILLTITERLFNFLKNEEQVYRMGGDEFVIIFENLTSDMLPKIKEIAKKICQLIAIPIPYANTTLNVTVSIGISIYPIDGEDEFTLVKAADRRMYKVKKVGGNNFETQETEHSIGS